jgi:predicted MFS family arabinose efflux permease
MQMRVVGEASAAPNLASTLNQGAFNLGNAVGAWLGGAAIALGARYDIIPGLGSVIALLALGLSTWSWRLDAGLSGVLGDSQRAPSKLSTGDHRVARSGGAG